MHEWSGYALSLLLRFHWCLFPHELCVQRWLYRTPIDGSLPSDPGDDAVVARFVQKYLDLHTEVQKANLERMTANGAPNIERVKAMQERNRKICVEWLQPEPGKVSQHTLN